MIVLEFSSSKETMVIISEELGNAFPKATLAHAKKCRTNQYGTAEPCLANAYQEIAEKDERYGHLKLAIGITREKSLEAINICKAPPASTPPKLVSLPFSPKKSLQDKFKIPDDRMTVKCYGSEGLLLAIELKKGILKTGKWSSGLTAKVDELARVNEELKTKVDELSKVNEELKAKVEKKAPAKMKALPKNK